MKKLLVLIISIIIFVVSVAVVSFLGLRIKTFEQTIYVNSIEINNQEIELVGEQKFIIFDYDYLNENNNVIQLDVHVYPDNATIRNVRYDYDEENSPASVNQYGFVSFSRPGGILITVRSTDGSKISTTIRVIALQSFEE